MTTPDFASASDLLRAALVTGDEVSLESLVAAGPVAVEEFRAFLSGESEIVLPEKIHPVIVLDNITLVSGRLGWTFPDEFVATFASTRWITAGSVLGGLGYTRREEARPILIRALQADTPATTRASAAASLASFPSAESVAVLLRALNDPDDLLRRQVIRSLGAIGDETALAQIRPMTEDTNRGIATAAAEAVMEVPRFHGRGGCVVIMPRVRSRSRWD